MRVRRIERLNCQRVLGAPRERRGGRFAVTTLTNWNPRAGTIDVARVPAMMRMKPKLRIVSFSFHFSWQQRTGLGPHPTFPPPLALYLVSPFASLLSCKHCNKQEPPTLPPFLLRPCDPRPRTRKGRGGWGKKRSR